MWNTVGDHKRSNNMRVIRVTITTMRSAIEDAQRLRMIEQMVMMTMMMMMPVKR